ncbi:uncharacterized protein [Chelonus insularis]|uniref:uncharacterized protein n=1 Tax=Chelonus insularis TaxID=460826 RepID=UPI00158EB0C9|nr:uncharacterized protein LOC118072405 [Chelonus insularis]
MMFSSITWMLFVFFSVVHGQEVFNTLPPPVMTSFTCKGRETGFYADIETNCRVYHTCDDHGNKFTYHCPQDTAFRQDSLVCDHAYRVDCQKSAELILQRSIQDSQTEPDNVQDFKTFSRSYQIAPKPSVHLLAPKESDQKPTTFVMRSTMFFRDQSNSRNDNRQSKSQKLIKENFSTSSTPPPSTTKQSFSQFQFKNSIKPFAVLEKPKNSLSDNESSAENFQHNRQNPFNRTTRILNNNNFPYIETLKSMQNYRNKENYFSTTVRTTTAGTEFPIPKFSNALSGFNSEDPYYPRSSSTEKVYSLSTKNKQKFPAFTTPNYQASSKELKIPDFLPDLNSVEDLVDRRKLFFIPSARKN